MARIRSIHPGLFTDEAFMAATPHARLLVIGLWGLAWDDGVFEWKPLTIKARIFPVDNVDVGELLAELEGLSIVRSYELGGKQLGVVRNFRRYQRPKKPNSSGLLPDQLRTFVGIANHSGEPAPPETLPSGEKSIQMEDGGGRREEERKNNNIPGSSKNGSGKYAFEFGVVKLNQHDLDQWQRAFPHVSVEAELMAAEPWLAKQPSWFQAAAGLLAKKERAAVIALERARAPPAKRQGYKDPLGNWVVDGNDE